MSDFSQINPTKNQHKITSKEISNTIQETKLQNEGFKKFRKNSSHNFHNRSGFYMD